MDEIQCIQGSDEWFQLRIGKITASNFGLIMPTPKQRDLPFNKTQLSYLHSVCAEIYTGVDEENFQSYWMDRGNSLEEEAKIVYAETHNVEIRDCGFFSDGDMIGGSPDGIISDVDIEVVLEVKCPKASTHVSYMLAPKKLFDQYKWQLIGEAYVAGTEVGEEAVIISYHPDFPTEKQIVEYSYSPTIEDFVALKNRLTECEKLLEKWIGYEES